MSPESTAISLLCVDDDPQILTLLKSFLEREPGFIVETSTSAAGALDLLNTRHFDAILSDYYMPEMDGIALLREIRARGIPALFVIFTGRHIARVAIDTLNNGGNFYMQKGSEFLDEIPKLVEFLKKRKAQGISHDEIPVNIARTYSFAEHQMDLLASFLPDGTITYINDVYSRSMGLQNSEISGTKFFLQIPDHERPEVMKLLAGLSPEKPGIYIEHPFNSPGGVSHLFQWGYSAIFNESGSVREFLAQGRDVSRIVHLVEEQKVQAQAGIRQPPVSSGAEPGAISPAAPAAIPTLETLAESIENLQYPIFAVNPEGTVIAWNAAIAEVTGIPGEEVIGKGNYAYSVPFYGEQRPMLVDYIIRPEENQSVSLPQTIKREGDAFIGSVENITLRGKPMLMGGRATAIHDTSGGIIAAVQSILVSEHHLGGTIDSLYEEEHYLGGVSSVILKVTGKGLAGAIAGAIGSAPGGYGVYATDRRLFVVHNPELDATRDNGVQFGTFLIDELFGTNVDLGVRSIHNLEKMKVFEVWRNDLVSIEMKKPRLLAGYLVFLTKNGESFRIYIDHQKAFTHLEQLMMLFYPEILKDKTQTIDDSDLAWLDEIRAFDLVGNLQLDEPLKDVARSLKGVPEVSSEPHATRSHVTAGEWSELRLAIEPIQYPIFAIDKTGTVIAWNTAIAKLTGIDAGTMIGKGDHAYAIPFYGETKSMLIDYIVMPPDADISGAMPEITREGDTFIGNLETVTIGGKPMLLWGKGTGVYDPKGTLIAAIQSILVSQQQVPKYADEDLFEESYIGGISSITVKVGQEGTFGAIAGALGSTTGGYGVYATDQRLFIIHNPELDASKPDGLQFGTFIIDELFGTTVDTRPRSIRELESRKIFEVPRKDIASIEMKKPMLLAGYILFKTKTGESFRVYIDHKRAYIHLDQLLRMFYPEITRFE